MRNSSENEASNDDIRSQRLNEGPNSNSLGENFNYIPSNDHAEITGNNPDLKDEPTRKIPSDYHPDSTSNNSANDMTGKERTSSYGLDSDIRKDRNTDAQESPIDNDISALKPICRVCRCEATTEQPLFHPCLCSGSIKYIHQECLVQWLTHSHKSHCELCGHAFSFKPIYSEDMPSQIPVYLLIYRIIEWIFQWIMVTTKSAMQINMWSLGVTMCTSWMWNSFFSSSNETSTLYLICKYVADITSKVFFTLFYNNFNLIFAIFNVTMDNPNHGSQVNQTINAKNSSFFNASAVHDSGNSTEEYKNYDLFLSIITDMFKGTFITLSFIVAFIMIVLIRDFFNQLNSVEEEFDEQLDVDEHSDVSINENDVVFDGSGSTVPAFLNSENPDKLFPEDPKVLDDFVSDNDSINASAGKILDENPNVLDKPSVNLNSSSQLLESLSDIAENEIWDESLSSGESNLSIQESEWIENPYYRDIEDVIAPDDPPIAMVPAVEQRNDIDAEPQVPRERDIFEPPDAQNQQNVDNEVPPNVREDIEPGIEVIGLVDFFGIGGPMLNVLINCLWILVFNFMIMFVLLYIPYIIGYGTLYSSSLIIAQFIRLIERTIPVPKLFLNSSSGVINIATKNSTITVHTKFQPEEALLSIIPNLYSDFIAILPSLIVGYITFFFVVYMALSLLRSAVRLWNINAEDSAIIQAMQKSKRLLNFFYLTFKVVGITIIELIIFPYCCGVIIDMCLFPVFYGVKDCISPLQSQIIGGNFTNLANNTLSDSLDRFTSPIIEFGLTNSTQSSIDRISLVMSPILRPLVQGLISRMYSLASYPLLVFFTHWAVGTFYMFCFAMFIGMFRKFFRPGVIWFIRDPQDPNFQPMKELVEKPLLVMLEKISLSFSIYVLLIVLSIGCFTYGIIALEWSFRVFISLISSQESISWNPVLNLMDVILRTNESNFLLMPLFVNTSSSTKKVFRQLNFLASHFWIPFALKLLPAAYFYRKIWQNIVRIAAKNLRLQSFLFGGRFIDDEIGLDCWDPQVGQKPAEKNERISGKLVRVVAQDDIAKHSVAKMAFSIDVPREIYLDETVFKIKTDNCPDTIVKLPKNRRMKGRNIWSTIMNWKDPLQIPTSVNVFERENGVIYDSDNFDVAQRAPWKIRSHYVNVRQFYESNSKPSPKIALSTIKSFKPSSRGKTSPIHTTIVFRPPSLKTRVWSFLGIIWMTSLLFHGCIAYLPYIIGKTSINNVFIPLYQAFYSSALTKFPDLIYLLPQKIGDKDTGFSTLDGFSSLIGLLITFLISKTFFLLRRLFLERKQRLQLIDYMRLSLEKFIDAFAQNIVNCRIKPFTTEESLSPTDERRIEEVVRMFRHNITIILNESPELIKSQCDEMRKITTDIILKYYENSLKNPKRKLEKSDVIHLISMNLIQGWPLTPENTKLNASNKGIWEKSLVAFDNLKYVFKISYVLIVSFFLFPIILTFSLKKLLFLPMKFTGIILEIFLGGFGDQKASAADGAAHKQSEHSAVDAEESDLVSTYILRLEWIFGLTILKMMLLHTEQLRMFGILPQPDPRGENRSFWEIIRSFSWNTYLICLNSVSSKLNRLNLNSIGFAEFNIVIWPILLGIFVLLGLPYALVKYFGVYLASFAKQFVYFDEKFESKEKFLENFEYFVFGFVYLILFILTGAFIISKFLIKRLKTAAEAVREQEYLVGRILRNMEDEN